MLSSWGGVPSQVQEELRISRMLTKPVKRSDLHEILRQEFNLSPAAQPVATPSAMQREKSRILLVEDIPENRDLALRILVKAGYPVDYAENGRDAVDTVMQRHYDLIFMDIQMPIMDGLEATREIRKLEKHLGDERTPILALTAHALQEYREKCVVLSMDDFLTKPIRKKVILDAAAKWIDTRHRILIVDDSACNRNLLAHNLSKSTDFRLLFAQNGQEAVQTFQRYQVSLVLMDMEMPVMNGYDATQAIRELDSGQHVPIVALTGHEGEEAKQKCLDAGCSDYLCKPIKKAALLEAVHSFIDISRDSGAPIESDAADKI